MIKINPEARKRIQSILSSRIDSKMPSDSSQESIFRKVLPLLPQSVSLNEFQSAISRFVENRQENPKKAFNLFIESLEISSIRVSHETIYKQNQAIKKTKPKSQEKKLSMERSPTRQGLKNSPIDKGRQKLRQNQMRLNDRDKLMATARRPDYIEDWNDFISELRKGSNNQTIKTLHNKLCQKWKLKSPIPPYLDKEGKDWEIIFKANQLEAILELTENEWPNSLYASLSLPIGKCVFVRLRIDLTRNQKELEKAFGEKIKSWTRNISKKTKPRKTQYDPWEIWGLFEKSGSLLAIARQKSGKRYLRGKKTPAYNGKLWGPYKRVKGAYDQALEMIQAAEPLHPFPIKS